MDTVKITIGPRTYVYWGRQPGVYIKEFKGDFRGPFKGSTDTLFLRPFQYRTGVILELGVNLQDRYHIGYIKGHNIAQKIYKEQVLGPLPQDVLAAARAIKTDEASTALRWLWNAHLVGVEPSAVVELLAGLSTPVEMAWKCEPSRIRAFIKKALVTDKGGEVNLKDYRFALTEPKFKCLARVAEQTLNPLDGQDPVEWTKTLVRCKKLHRLSWKQLNLLVRTRRRIPPGRLATCLKALLLGKRFYLQQLEVFECGSLFYIVALKDDIRGMADRLLDQEDRLARDVRALAMRVAAMQMDNMQGAQLLELHHELIRAPRWTYSHAPPDATPFDIEPEMKQAQYGNTTLEWLVSPAELSDEGVKMQHCVSIYDTKCRRGAAFIYKVTHKGKHVGTLELDPLGMQAQLFGKNNSQVPAKVQEDVNTIVG